MQESLLKQLFVGKMVLLAPIDHDSDAVIESRWTHDMSYMRNLGAEPAIPLSATQLKKRYKELEKEQEENKSLYYFTIRTRQDQRLVGFIKLFDIDWVNGSANVQLGIGDLQDRRTGYGTQALRMVVDFAFHELGLWRLAAHVPAYNQAALELFRMQGFVEEVRRREALFRDGTRWDMLHMGLLSTGQQGR